MYNAYQERILPDIITDKKIAAQEITDKEIYKRFMARKGKEATYEDQGQYSKFDLIQYTKDKEIDILDNKILIDFKTRIRYHFNQFPTARISLHKFKDLYNAVETEGAQRAFIISAYPYDNKWVLWDITNIDFEDIFTGESEVKIVTVAASKCSTKDNSDKRLQQMVELPLQKNRFTYIYDDDLSDYEDIMLKNMKNQNIPPQYLYV